MTEIMITQAQARRFLLVRQGLLGTHRFVGKAGALDYVRRMGCLQYDPVDICGRNADLALNARVKGYQRSMLWQLLYTDRLLVDHYDKEMAIYPAEDWPGFARQRDYYKRHTTPALEAARPALLAALAAGDGICAADVEGMADKVDWPWGPTKLARAGLEHLYHQGEAGLHHKKGSLKYYAPIDRCLDAGILTAPDPYPAEADYIRWRVLRRIGAVGLLWNKGSAAWLGIPHLHASLKAADREQAFAQLCQNGDITPVTVEGIRAPLYCLTTELPLLKACAALQSGPVRCELLAPLDCLLWDRPLIEALFGFSYKWEVYTPADKRQYGHYTLPVLYGERFVGRIEPVFDRRAGRLAVRGLWLEEGVRHTKKLQAAIDAALRRLERMNKSDEN